MVRRLCLPAVSIGAVVGMARVLAWGTAEPLAAARGGEAGLDEFLGLAAALAAWAVLGWLTAALAATALAAAPGVIGRLAGRAAARITPLATRRLARIAVGLAVTAGPVAACAPAAGEHLASGVEVTVGQATIDPSELPGVGRPGQPVMPAVAAAASEPAPHPSVHATLSAAPSEPGDTGPAQAAGLAPAAGLVPEPAHESADESVREVVVRRGDSLWSIAARHLGPQATVAQVAAEWPRWHAANRAVIGADPDMILPGMVLRPPEAADRRTHPPR